MEDREKQRQSHQEPYRAAPRGEGRPHAPSHPPAPSGGRQAHRAVQNQPHPPAHRPSAHRTQEGALATSLIPILILVALLLLTITAAVIIVRSRAEGPNPPALTDGESTDGMSESTPPTSESGGSNQTAQRPESDPPTSKNDPPAPEAFTFPAEMNSRYAILIHRESGEVIAAKNADTVSYPASVTKVMTVLVALEKLEDPSVTFTVTKELINRLAKANASRAGFAAGEVVTATDLMYAALLPSGADGSVGLAELVAGGEEAFAVLMNEKAAALGMTQTHFVNATGLHAEGHVSTARDLAILMDAAMKNEQFRKMFADEWHESAATSQHPNGLWMRSTLSRYLEEEELVRDYFIGGKTGYTEEAGMCLASVAKWKGEEYILVTLGAGSGENRPRLQARDAVLVFDALFTRLS